MKTNSIILSVIMALFLGIFIGLNLGEKHAYKNLAQYSTSFQYTGVVNVTVDHTGFKIHFDENGLK